MKAQKFLESKEQEWIKAIGKDKWLKEKVYFTYEVIEFLNDFENFIPNEPKTISNNEHIRKICASCSCFKDVILPTEEDCKKCGR